MPIQSDNLNLNLNLNLGASSGTGGGVTGYGRPRFNTEDMCKLALPLPATLPLPRDLYSENWDAEMRTWGYVEEFVLDCRWARMTPILFIRRLIDRQTRFPVPARRVARPLTPALLADQVNGVLNASLDRADRAMEILDQATAVGALNYWTGLLRLDPSQDRGAFLLMLVGRRIGEYVAMGLKGEYLMRRPSQVFPMILPVIDPPDTPSFPSSHALQAHLISGLLTMALRTATGRSALALAELAQRVALNREIAGVHYNMDSAAGAFAAAECVRKLAALPRGSRFKTLLRRARRELRGLP